VGMQEIRWRHLQMGGIGAEEKGSA